MAIAFFVGLHEYSFARAQETGQANITVQQISFGSGAGAEVKIALSQPVIPCTMLLSSPARLVIDLPNALTGSELGKNAIGNDQIKSVRVGLFQANPPVTRVVVDLKENQGYEVHASGNLLLVTITNPGRQENTIASVQHATTTPIPKLIKSASTVAAPKTRINAPQSAPRFQVQSGRGGALTIHASNATLAEVLFEVQQKTGAEIPIPSGAEQERVTADLGPGPARDTLSSLLNGTHFNFVMVGAESDPGKLRSVILTPKFGDSPKPANNTTPAPLQEYPEPEVIQMAPEPDPATVELQPDGIAPPPSEPPPTPPDAAAGPPSDPTVLPPQ
ncbi:MAG: AMIN domain-containing protein [Acidobacteriota bacterium]|nr:AMIN domain-containing protein [Acidobacteriota bacterium]